MICQRLTFCCLKQLNTTTKDKPAYILTIDSSETTTSHTFRRKLTVAKREVDPDPFLQIAGFWIDLWEATAAHARRSRPRGIDCNQCFCSASAADHIRANSTRPFDQPQHHRFGLVLGCPWFWVVSLVPFTRPPNRAPELVTKK